MCSDNKGVPVIRCEELPEQLYWHELIMSGYTATYNFKPISKYLGSITMKLSSGDKILTDGETIIVNYTDGVKQTINKSWFN